MLEILGYMFAVYAGWRIVMQMADIEKTTTVQLVLSAIGLLGIVTCAFLLGAQAKEVQEAVNPII